MTTMRANKTGYALFIIGLLFFIFGFVTWLNGTLIPFLKLTCELSSDLLAFFVTFAFYLAYFFLAIPSAYILSRTGYKNGMALGLLVMALGTLLFLPAAHIRNFPLFLVGLFIQASGLALLQTASNPYVSILGPLDSAARRISIMGVCNKTAGMIAPFVIGSIVLKNASELEAKIKAAASLPEKEAMLNMLAGRVIPPYLIMTVVLVLLAAMIKASSLPEINLDDEKATDAGTRTNVFQIPHLMLGVLCLFLYVGVEVLAGDGISTFGRASGISLDTARFLTSFTMGAMLLGYIIGIIAIPKYLSQSTALRISAISGLIFGVCILLTHGYTSIAFIVLLGLSNSLMWPAIWPLVLDGLGKFTKIGSALLIMGIVGGSIIPMAYPALKDSFHLGNNLAFFACIIPCYAFILYYAVKGHMAGKPKLALA